MERTKLEKYSKEAISELTGNILPFWMKNVINYGSGSFNGSVAGGGTINPSADKGAVMAARILWTFSRAFIKLNDAQYLRTADLMFKYIVSHFLDKKHGGVFWTLDGSGKPLVTTKKMYAQGFTMYAFAEYAKASGSSRALDEAKNLFSLVEKYGRDIKNSGYIDALSADWSLISDMRLSAKEMNTPKSMNTNLHVMEALSVLVMYFKDKQALEALENIVNVFAVKMLMPNKHFGMFFDRKWNGKSGIISYGHDIEGSWLITEAAEITGSKVLIELADQTAIHMAEAVLKEGLDKDGSLFNEGDESGPHKMRKEWWMQAEAMVGFLNAYQLTKKEVFLEKSISVWEYVKKNFRSPQGEWYFFIGIDGKPGLDHDLAGPWKCPYHNGRACLEVYERIEKLLK